MQRTMQKNTVWIFAILLAVVMVMAAGFAGCADASKDEAPQDTENTATVAPTDADETQAPTEPTPEETVAPTEAPTPTEAPDHSGGIVSEDAIEAAFFDMGISNQAYCGTGHVLATQFYATTDFNAVGYGSPTWTSKENYFVDYELYAWNHDYEDTLAGEPVATAHLENWPDGECAKLEVAEALPAGEYLLVARYGSLATMDNSGVWYGEQEHPSQICYLDDQIWYDVHFRLSVFYTRTPANLYGPLSDPGF